MIEQTCWVSEWMLCYEAHVRLFLDDSVVEGFILDVTFFGYFPDMCLQQEHTEKPGTVSSLITIVHIEARVAH